MRNINTYTDHDLYVEENERIGYWSDNDYPCNRYDIWTCELYRNKKTQKYSILITADSDEQWSVIEFE